MPRNHVNRDPRAPLSQMSSHIGSIPIHSANQHDREPRSARAGPLSKANLPIRGSYVLRAERLIEADVLGRPGLGRAAPRGCAWRARTSAPAQRRGRAVQPRPPDTKVDARQDQRRSPEDRERRHSIHPGGPRRPPPHSAHRACAVEVAARPSLLEELRRLPLNTETGRDSTEVIHNLRSITLIRSLVGRIWHECAADFGSLTWCGAPRKAWARLYSSGSGGTLESSVGAGVMSVEVV